MMPGLWPLLAADPTWWDANRPLIQRGLDELNLNGILYVTWAGLFGATFVLVRMLYTRWGESNVTAKALAVSALVHLAGGFWTTTVRLASGRAETTVVERVPIRRVIIESRTSRASAEDRQIPSWEQPLDIPREALSRVTRDSVETAAPSVEKQRVADVMAAVTPTLVDRPAAVDQPLAARDAARSRATVSGALNRIAEETAETRAEMAVTEGDVSRTGPARAGNPELRVNRGARPGVESLSSTPPTPTPTNNLPARANVPETARQSGTDGSPARRREPQEMARISPDDAGTSTDGSMAEAGRGERTGNPFARSGGVSKPGAATATPDLRSGRKPESPTGSGQPIELRTGIPLGMADAVPPAAREEMAAVIQSPSRVPATYRLRGAPQRKRVAVEMGATEASELAVERSLKWLAAHQNEEGFWDPDGFTRHCPPGKSCGGEATLGRDPTDPSLDVPARQQSGIKADAGITALALLAFLGAGHTPFDGDYADQVDRGLRWLVSQQTEDGFLGGPAARYARMYCHGMATIALGEAYAMTNDPALRNPLERAVRYILDEQLTDGSWRYGGKLTEDGKPVVGDMSIFGWQLMALRSASLAGIPVPPEALEKARGYLRTAAQGRNGGLAAYGGFRNDTRVRPTMTAEAQYCRQLLKMSAGNPAQSQEAIDYVLQYLPTRGSVDLYFWYYGTLSVYHHGNRASWVQWNSSMRDTLVADQVTTGHAAGSWEPRYPWGDYGGRVFSTAMSTLCLEVYYRFLPLYQSQEAQRGLPPTRR
jgi:hypothetical protein